jgi:hypothetical protein
MDFEVVLKRKFVWFNRALLSSKSNSRQREFGLMLEVPCNQMMKSGVVEQRGAHRRRVNGHPLHPGYRPLLKSHVTGA